MLWVAAVAGVVLAAQADYLLRHPEVWPPDDSIEYWAAARLVLQSDNPYAPESLLPLQRAGGRETSEAVMMWNPPWTLALVLPLGALPARAAQLLWLAVHLAVLVYCGDRLWQLYGGRRERRWLGWLLTMAALPTLFALQAGQITPLVLLGAVLWLQAQQSAHRWSRTGTSSAALLLLSIKPHLAVLLGLTLAAWVVRQRQWVVAAGGILAVLAAAGVVMVWRPLVLADYASALLHRPPAQWHSPTVGAYLRLWLGVERFYLQFLPTLAGAAAVVIWLVRGNPQVWCWRSLLPALLLASLVAAPYGAWPFDLVLLLPAVFVLLLQMAPQWGPRGVWLYGGGLLSINLGCLGLNLMGQPSSLFVWVAPAVGLLYTVAALGTVLRRRHEVRPVGVELA